MSSSSCPNGEPSSVARRGQSAFLGGGARFGVVGGLSWAVSRGRSGAGDVARTGLVACVRTSQPLIVASSVLRMSSCSVFLIVAVRELGNVSIRGSGALTLGSGLAQYSPIFFSESIILDFAISKIDEPELEDRSVDRSLN